MEKNKREGQKCFFGGLFLSLSLFERLNKRLAWFCRTVSYNLVVLSHIFVHGNHLGDYTKNFQPENPERVRWNGIKSLDNHPVVLAEWIMHRTLFFRTEVCVLGVPT